MFDYRNFVGFNIQKERWVLADICEKWVEQEKVTKERKRINE